MEYFADNLRYLRKLKGLSQEELADHLDLNRGNIASYEKGSAEPRMKNLLKIVKFFNVELGDLLEKDLEYQDAVRKELHKIGRDEKIEEFSSRKAQEHLVDELIDNKDRLEKIITNSDEMQKILDGFRHFHKFKMTSSRLTEDMKKMALDYEKLLDVTDALLSTNKQLIGILDERKKTGVESD